MKIGMVGIDYCPYCKNWTKAVRDGVNDYLCFECHKWYVHNKFGESINE